MNFLSYVTSFNERKVVGMMTRILTSKKKKTRRTFSRVKLSIDRTHRAFQYD